MTDSLADRQAALLAAGGWPWTSIPPAYRRRGRPSQAVTEAARTCVGYDDDRTRAPVLVLSGPVGTGKTTAACQLAAWMAAGWGWTDPEAVAYQLALRMAWLPGPEIAALVARPVRALVLDDLSAGLSAAALTNALELIEGRIAWRRRTIVTTSLSMSELAQAEARAHGREIGLASRLSAGVVLTVGGGDRRLVTVPPAPPGSTNDPDPHQRKA